MEKFKLFKLPHHGLEFGGLIVVILFDAFAGGFPGDGFLMGVEGGVLAQVDGLDESFEFGAAEGGHSDLFGVVEGGDGHEGDSFDVLLVVLYGVFSFFEHQLLCSLNYRLLLYK